MAVTPTDIANRALDEIGSTAIGSLQENSLQAKVCARQYPAALNELLSGAEWGFAKRRVQLVATTNARADGGYAYLAPNDMRQALRLIPYAASGSSQALAIPAYNVDGLKYDLSDGLFYARHSGVVLEYITNDPDPNNMPADFMLALVNMLAAKIVYPLQKDRAAQTGLLQTAELYRQRAIANGANQMPATYGNFIPEVAQVVLGISDGIDVDAVILNSGPSGYTGVL